MEIPFSFEKNNLQADAATLAQDLVLRQELGHQLLGAFALEHPDPRGLIRRVTVRVAR